MNLLVEGHQCHWCNRALHCLQDGNTLEMQLQTSCVISVVNLPSRPFSLLLPSCSDINKLITLIYFHKELLILYIDSTPINSKALNSALHPSSYMCNKPPLIVVKVKTLHLAPYNKLQAQHPHPFNKQKVRDHTLFLL